MNGNKRAFARPEALPVIHELPDAMIFLDGRQVETKADWTLRAEELKELYQYYLYGYMPDRSEERMEWERTDSGLLIHVTRQGKTASFPVLVSLPSADCGIPEPYPVIVSLGLFEQWNPGGAPDTDYTQQANQRGYAVITLHTEAVASDSAARSGAFFDMYPYSPEGYDVGVFVAWAWAAGRILDALEDGAYPEINPKQAIVTGFSRWGKAAMVAAMLDERIAIVNPHCSGAGGLASFRHSFGGKPYPWGIAEPSEGLQVLQCDAEAHWFSSVFLGFKEAEQIPLDQHELAALAAPRSFLATGGYADDWTNPEGMHVSYVEAAKVYRFLGAEDRIGFAFRPGTHARTQEDIDHLLDFCDRELRGIDKGMNFKVSLYDME